MSEEFAGLRARDVVRWVVLGLVLLACLGAYFAYSPEVRPAFAPAAAEP